MARQLHCVVGVEEIPNCINGFFLVVSYKMIDRTCCQSTISWLYQGTYSRLVDLIVKLAMFEQPHYDHGFCSHEQVRRIVTMIRYEDMNTFDFDLSTSLSSRIDISAT